MTTLTQLVRGRIWIVGLATALVLGAVLRLVWGTDIEYKLDEAWTFDRAQRIGRTEPFPWIGMPTSVETRHPGMSIWVFVGLSRLFAARGPVDLARAVQLLNIAAILLLVVFVLRSVPECEREPWLWAAAFICVHPLAVLFHRKTGPPSVLPIFGVLLLMSWWKRHRRGGAFAWGLIGACVGQVLEAGFFFAAGFVAWAMLFEPKRVAWRSWLLGSGVGALPLIPWLRYLSTEFGNRPIPVKWTRSFELKYWMRWVTEPAGLGIESSLGPHFTDFLSYPLVGGRSTYLVLLLHLVVVAAGMTILVRAASAAWPERRAWRDWWIGRDSPTAFTQSAALWGCGILFTASGLFIHRHYMILTWPLECLWLARLAIGERPGVRKGGRGLLLTLWVSQLLISASFLAYIHVNKGAIHGDYGVAYGAQTAEIHPPMEF